ncbi:MAG: hypothetical protein ACRC9H_15210 [Aeromonas veronii]
MAQIPHDELIAQLRDATEQCGLLAGLLREARPYILDSGIWWRRTPTEFRAAIDAALSGSLSDPLPTPAAYRSLHDRHDHALSLLADVLRWSQHRSSGELARLLPRIEQAIHPKEPQEPPHDIG